MSLAPTSPRLPSPPPPTEIQIGPQSPSLGGPGGQDGAIEQSILDANSARRIQPGTRSADMSPGPPLVPLGELDSAFQLQEHLKALHYHHTRSADSSHTFPMNRDTARIIAEPPHGIDRQLWLYELCRFLINKCNDLIIGFLFDSPPCSSTTCPEMRASEWQFLCAVHESPKSCCAIDYCCHTLDWAAGVVTSQKHFPSRLSLGGGAAFDDSGNNVKHLVNIFRRLHRIFAHAWFQHRGVFWQVEEQTGLYVLFKMVCDCYDLLPAENYKLPPEAEGLEPIQEAKAVPTILRSEPASVSNVTPGDGEDPATMSIGRTNTRRHIRASPSTGSAVTTVLESEEDESDVSHRLGSLQLGAEEDSTNSRSSEGETGEVDAEGAEEDTDDSEDADITIIADEDTLADGQQGVEDEGEGMNSMDEPTVGSPTLPGRLIAIPVEVEKDGHAGAASETNASEKSEPTAVSSGEPAIVKPASEASSSSETRGPGGPGIASSDL